MRTKIRPYLLLAAGALILAVLAGIWQFYASPTGVAFVNYPEYILAPLLDQKINPSIEVTALQWKEENGEELKKFDCIIFFGMGLNFTEKQQAILSTLKKPIYTTASTRKETALNTLTEEQLKKAGCEERKNLPYHKMLLNGELPYTIGGGIGQSRLCMLLLDRAHIGEVQASIWPEEMRETCKKHHIILL